MSDITTAQDLTEVVAELFGDVELVTPYQLIKVLNSVTGRNLPTQMAYNYVKKGFIPTTTNEVGKKVITTEDAVTWIVKYIEKNV